MKQVTTNLLETLSNVEIEKLTTEVKETLAKNLANAKKKVFTSADLWNIQRQTKVNFFRRQFL